MNRRDQNYLLRESRQFSLFKSYKKDSLLEPYWTTSILHIKFPMQLTVKLPKNKWYHHKTSSKLENMLKTVIEMNFVFTPLNYLLNKVIQIKSFFCSNFQDRDSCPFQQILEITSTLKLTWVSFIITSVLSLFCPFISFF